MPIISAVRGDEAETWLTLECPTCGKLVLHPSKCGHIFCEWCPMRSPELTIKCPECKDAKNVWKDGNGNWHRTMIGRRERDECLVKLNCPLGST